MTAHRERRAKRERNQQVATSLMFIIKLLSQHVSGIIMPIIRRTTPTPNTPDLTDIRIRYHLNTTAYTYTHEIPTVFTTHYSTQIHYGSHILWFPPLLQCRTPYVVVHSLVLLMMCIMMPETCWDRSLIINIRLVASCWLLSLHTMFVMHGHKSLKAFDYLHPEIGNWVFLTCSCGNHVQ